MDKDFLKFSKLHINIFKVRLIDFNSVFSLNFKDMWKTNKQTNNDFYVYKQLLHLEINFIH